jgi:hypothetical protein
MHSTTDNTNSPATLGSGLPGTAADNMSNHLQPAQPEAKTVTAQVPPPEVTETSAWGIEGSHVGDHRSEAAQPNPLAGNDTPPRGETEGGA